MMNEEKDLWGNYSGMPSPMSYMRCDKCDEVQSECKCKEKIMNKEQLYSEIENLIITWNIDGTKTAGSLTREIMKLLESYE
jgi:hypothetical protein